VKIGCNMRFGVLKEDDYKLMGRAGFRFILYGLESANQKTLNHLQKGTTNEEAWQACKWAKKYGMNPHLTIMMGYPWETYEDAKKTIEFTKKIFNAGFVETLQATIVIPYPGTVLYDQCKKNGWLITEDYDRYDMREAVMKSELTGEQVKELTQDLYKVFLSPRYIVRKALSIRTKDDIVFAMRGVKYIYGHLKDFSTRNKYINAQTAQA
ncbi:MAG: radical SAM protein, partial [Conexivisphaerales archaeon]